MRPTGAFGTSNGERGVTLRALPVQPKALTDPSGQYSRRPGPQRGWRVGWGLGPDPPGTAAGIARGAVRGLCRNTKGRQWGRRRRRGPWEGGGGERGGERGGWVGGQGSRREGAQSADSQGDHTAKAPLVSVLRFSPAGEIHCHDSRRHEGCHGAGHPVPVRRRKAAMRRGTKALFWGGNISVGTEKVNFKKKQPVRGPRGPLAVVRS